MKLSVAAVVAVIVSVSALQSGCGQDRAVDQSEQATVVAGDPLGTLQKSGPLMVTMMTEPPQPHIGAHRLQITVADEDGPAEDASVFIDLSMPEMAMDGPRVELEHMGIGRYEGVTELSMGGKWEADVTVQVDDHVENFKYAFTVLESAPAPETEAGVDQ